MIQANLFFQFLIIGFLAFGGGQAALPLVERVSVVQMGWVSPTAFAAAIAFGYVTPGPVLIVSTFVGYLAAGLSGAIAATSGAFLAPTLLAVGVAASLERIAENRWLKAFGEGATPAVIGLLGATTWNLAQHSLTSAATAAIAILSFIVSLRTQLSPVWILLAGTLIEWAVGYFLR